MFTVTPSGTVSLELSGIVTSRLADGTRVVRDGSNVVTYAELPSGNLYVANSQEFSSKAAARRYVADLK